ncbi:MAG TPA: matrixin family metalloprotease [Iamia sp.]
MLPGFLATLAAGAVVVAVVATRADDGPRRSSSPSTTSVPSEEPGATFVLDGRSYPYPTPAPEADEPLGQPAPLHRGGSFAFARIQPGTDDDPVTWDPCRPIRVVVADEAAPDRAEGIVEEALATLSEATGLQIEVEGTTTEPAAEERAPVQPDRYGDRWAPVLVAWTDPTEVPALDGDTGGLGGAVAVDPPGGGPEVYVTGQLLLDAPQMADALRTSSGRDLVRGVALHELGHLVGLAHVEDAGQLMYAEGQTGVTAYGFGDRAGLIEVGRGPCVPDL